jgi:protein phosphatase 1 regulatory subunit 21
MNSAAISDKDHQLLSTKYTKLAAEYSKVRAQLGVLKKAVLEEQAKNVGSSDNLKQKEQALRKSEAEMDSLTFRNQQLTRRVEILQDDLEKKVIYNKGAVPNQGCKGYKLSQSNI